jgi:hypothetical protein
MTDSTPALDYVEAHLDDSLDRLFALMRVQSVSTDPAYADQCQRRRATCSPTS